jgi:hypothetical protein
MKISELVAFLLQKSPYNKVCRVIMLEDPIFKRDFFNG